MGLFKAETYRAFFAGFGLTAIALTLGMVPQLSLLS